MIDRLIDDTTHCLDSNIKDCYVNKSITFNLGVTNVRFTAYDTWNNSAICDFIVDVQDRGKPVIILPDISCTDGKGLSKALTKSESSKNVLLQAFATDNIGVASIHVVTSRPTILDGKKKVAD